MRTKSLANKTMSTQNATALDPLQMESVDIGVSVRRELGSGSSSAISDLQDDFAAIAEQHRRLVSQVVQEQLAAAARVADQAREAIEEMLEQQWEAASRARAGREAQLVGAMLGQARKAMSFAVRVVRRLPVHVERTVRQARRARLARVRRTRRASSPDGRLPHLAPPTWPDASPVAPGCSE